MSLKQMLGVRHSHVQVSPDKRKREAGDDEGEEAEEILCDGVHCSDYLVLSSGKLAIPDRVWNRRVRSEGSIEPWTSTTPLSKGFGAGRNKRTRTPTVMTTKMAVKMPRTTKSRPSCRGSRLWGRSGRTRRARVLAPALLAAVECKQW